MGMNTMRISLAAVAFAAVAAGIPTATLAADQASGPDIENLIRRMEDSGALDAAIDRGIERHIKRQMEARQREQEAQQQRQAQAARNARPVDVNRDRIFGNLQADVNVIVYTDLECPFCKRFAGIPEQAVAKFDGKANVVFRHYPLDFHGENAKRGAYYAECVGRQAGSKAFFAFANEWFMLTGSNGKGLDRGEPQIREIALKAGAKDLAALDTCAMDPMVKQLVQDDMVDGTRGGVTGTPGVIVRNNKTGMALSITGAVPAEALEKAIAQALAG